MEKIMSNFMPLFAIKTNLGFGLFQEFGAYIGKPFYIVYYNQISRLCDEQINIALSGDYYLSRLNFKMAWSELWGYEVDKLISKPNNWFFPTIPNAIVNAEGDHFFGGTQLLYFGEYSLPQTAVYPKIAKLLDLNYFSGTHYWTLFDEVNGGYLDGKFKKYKRVFAEMLEFPNARGIYPRELKDRFDTGFKFSDYNDDWAEAIIEKRYQEEPYLRPCKEKYEDVKYPLPTENWRKFEGINDEYIAFCDKVEEAIKAFIAAIDENKKAVSKPLTVLLTELNKINSEVYGIDTLEAEKLYDYIAKILRALKKPQMIDNIENMREW
jgi:hypothetical protein